MKSSRRILVIEDNLMNMELITDLLQGDGHEVIQAFDAPTGLDLARTAPLPDLILMDIALPGMDGVEAARRLKADPVTVRIPIIAVTASAMRVNCETLSEVGCEDVVFKPIDFTEFRAKMNQALTRKDPAP